MRQGLRTSSSAARSRRGHSSPARQYATTGFDPSSIAAADLTGSGSIDLVVANYGSGSVSVYLPAVTPGTSVFAPAVNVVTGGQPNQVVIGDLNGDGKPDLVVADLSPKGNAIVLLQNPAAPGTFMNPVDLPTGNGPAHWPGSASRRVDGDRVLLILQPGAAVAHGRGVSQRLAGGQNRRPRRLQARVHPELPFADLLQPVQTLWGARTVPVAVTWSFRRSARIR